MEKQNLEKQDFKLLDPKEVEIGGKTFILSKFSAFDGYEIMIRYLPVHLSNLNGDFDKIKEMVLKVMKYVAVKVDFSNSDGTKGVAPVRLETETLVNNHCSSGKIIMEVTAAMMDYNTVFFGNGKDSTFWEKLESLAEEKITEILTRFAVNLSQKTKPLSGN